MRNVTRKTTVFIGLCLAVFAFITNPPALTHANEGEPEPQFGLIGQFGGKINALSVDGNTAYVVMGSHLSILDVSNPAAPTLIGKSDRLPTTSLANDIDVEESTAYITVGYDGLITMDISDLASPTYLGTFETERFANEVKVRRNIAYIADVANMMILDVTVPAAPLLLSTYDTNGQVKSIDVVDNIAYIADYTTQLQIVDVADPTSPTLINTFELNDDNETVAMSVQVVDGVAYVVMGTMLLTHSLSDSHVGYVSSNVVMVDASDPAAPIELGSFDDSTSGYASFNVVDGVAYMVESNGLKIVDVSDPAALVIIGSFNTSDVKVVMNVQVVGEIAYIADKHKGLVTVDVSDPAAPSKLGSFNPGTGGYSIDIEGDIAYVADIYNGLLIMDISDPIAPAPLGSFENDGNAWGGFAQDVQVVGDLAYVAYAYDGLLIVDVSDPTSPYLIGAFNMERDAFNASSVQVVGNVAYVAGGRSSFGLTIVDVSDPSAPSLISSIKTGDSKDVHVLGSVAYVADGGYGKLTTVNVSNPEQPTIMSSTSNSQNHSTSVQVVNDMAYIANGTGGFEILDVSNPASPSFVSRFRPENGRTRARSVHVVDDIAYVLFDCIYGCEASLVAIDVSQPDTPELLESVDVEGNPLNVYAEDGVLYVSVRERGMFLLEHVPPPPGGDDVPVIDIIIGD